MLKAESVSLELNGRAIVRNINFSLRNGELMAVVGANGAGKSSLISLLNGSRKPTEGRVILDERDITP
jgi:iron complex transport system ATP-binding protein